MKPGEAIERLDELSDELRLLHPSWKSTEFRSWKLRARSLLRRLLGADHHITKEFEDLDWVALAFGGESSDRAAFSLSSDMALGIFDAAAAETQLLADDVPIADEAGIDPELWEHVMPEVQSEAWVKVARGALIFTEDRLRKWANRPASEVGGDLAVAIFGRNGDYRLGIVEGEKDGWQLFAQGIAKALRNVDTHRIQERSDLKRYALGVVGSCSLLLTQMRYMHGNRFVDTSPASTNDTQEE
jgi:hypothetical protein